MIRRRYIPVRNVAELNALQHLASRIFRIARKSRTFRTVINQGIGGPSWSKHDILSFAREGYKGNPYVYSACGNIIQGMAEPPPILYRVRPGSKIEKAYKSEYGYERSLKGFSSKPWSLSGAAQQSIGFRSSRIMRMTGTTPSLAKRVAVKQLAFEGELEEVISHPILDLLSRPNGWYQTSYVEFVHAWGLSMLLAGEIFTEPITNASEGKAPDQLFVLPAHRMRPGRGTEANPIPKWFQTGRSSDSWTYSPDPMETEIFFNKLYDPINPLRGLSPMEATVRSVDLNNQARAWNLTFLQNAAVPPALVTGEFDAPGAEAIREEYSENLAGASNAGNIITLSGKNLKYEQLSMDAAKLMWGDVIEMTAKEVAIVFGVPPEILGDSSNKTYSNYQEARLALYQDRILPACDFMFSSWNSSWVRRFGEENLVLDYDTDQILAIAADVQKIYDRLKSASFLTFNEKREAVGYPRTDGGDVILIPITMIPLDMVSEGDVDGLKSHIAYVAKMLASENISIDGNNGIE